ncbi:MAG: PKD domain-containing protein, partial [Deltaproteobacteria bacterium]
DVRGLATLDFTLGRSYTTPPVAVAGPPQEVRERTPVTFDGSRSFDPDSAKGDRIVSFQWDFGDMARAEGPLVTHVYDTPGVYTVTLTVTDQTNNQATSETEVTVVANEAPLAEVAEGRRRGTAGEPVSLDASASHDPDGDPLRYLWEVTGRPPGSAALLSAATIPTTALLPDLPGIYTVRLRVADIFGKEAEPVEVSIEVAAARTETATPNATEGGGGCALLPSPHRRGGHSLPLPPPAPLRMAA